MKNSFLWYFCVYKHKIVPKICNFWNIITLYRNIRNRFWLVVDYCRHPEVFISVKNTKKRNFLHEIWQKNYMPFFMCTLSFLCISSYVYYKIIETLQLSSQNIHILIKIKKILENFTNFQSLNIHTSICIKNMSFWKNDIFTLKNPKLIMIGCKIDLKS